MKDIKVYMAGGLFTMADGRERMREAALLELAVKGTGKNVNMFSPIYSPVNDKDTLPTAESIFLADYKELMSSTVVFADISTEDVGVMYELGLVHDHKDIEVIAYDTDIRTATAGNYDGIRVPVAKNQFCVGGLLQNGVVIHDSFESALDYFVAKYLVDHA